MIARTRKVMVDGIQRSYTIRSKQIQECEASHLEGRAEQIDQEMIKILQQLPGRVDVKYRIADTIETIQSSSKCRHNILVVIRRRDRKVTRRMIEEVN